MAEHLRHQDIPLHFDRNHFSADDLEKLYRAILKPRLIEEKMLILLRQGRISKWFAGIGQEAIAVGASKAMMDEEMILPMHRNLGVFTSRDVPLERLFLQFQGKAGGFTSGRDRSFHFGTLDYHIHGMISHLGPQLSVADGYALGHLLRKESMATLVFTGEGGSSEGEFHEALNVAAVWNLPVLFLIENNGYGLSTPVIEQYKIQHLSDKGIGYGIPSKTIEGNNILEVYSEVKKITEEIRKNPHPFLLECMTFRMRGHEEASGTKYVPRELMDAWAKKDPVLNFEQYLIDEKILTKKAKEDIRAEIKEEINEAWKKADHAPELDAVKEKEIQSVYAPSSKQEAKPTSDSHEIRFVDAIADGLHEAMKKYPQLILMGQDIAEYGGVFKITQGLMESFGAERVRNTPLCESAILGTGLGLAASGFKSMIEMQFADFVSCGFNQIVNNVAKIYYRWGVHADMVVRMPCGGGVAAGPFHSQSNEAWFTHVPGLKVLYPSTPADAKGLLLAAFEDPNPILFFEHKALYRSIKGEVPEAYYLEEIGKARLHKTGEDVSIITYGAGVHWALEVLKQYPVISADLLDLRTLIPFDKEAILATVKKTGKLIILHEDTLSGGIGGELSAWIAEHAFEYLDAPIIRCASLDTPVPFAPTLEAQFMAKSRFEKQLIDLVQY